MRCIAITLAALGVVHAAYRNVVYFAEWAPQGGYHLNTLDWSMVTHINYAFAIPQVDGTLKFEDEHAALRQNYSQVQGQLQGNFGLANALKRKHRHVKVGLSIGGGSGSIAFPQATAPHMREKFVDNIITLLLDLGLDFIDVDWEFPSEPQDMANLVALLRALRVRVNQLSFKAEVTIASLGYRDSLWAKNLAAICGTVDAVNIMAYDFKGSWSEKSGYHSNLFSDGKATNSVDNLVAFYLESCPPNKLVIGMPIYSRKFQETDGLYMPFNKALAESDGATAYRALPFSQEVFDSQTKSAYIYDRATRTLHTYDNPTTVVEKCNYIKQKFLGGAMFWEASQDVSGDLSLIHASFRTLHTFDTTLNNLNYPSSKYDNVRHGASNSGNGVYGCRTYAVQPTDTLDGIIKNECQVSHSCKPTYPTVYDNTGVKCPQDVIIGDHLLVCCEKPAMSAVSIECEKGFLSATGEGGIVFEPAHDYQRWILDVETQHIKMQGTASCLTAENPRNAIKLKTCRPNEESQQWIFNATTRHLQHVKWAGQCLDSIGGISRCIDGSKLQELLLQVIEYVW